MGKKLTTTPRGKVRSAHRQLWLRSRERAAALKRDNYTCTCCNRKQSRAKGREFSVEVHHAGGKEIPWEDGINWVFEHILVDPALLVTMCPECHDKEHGKDKAYEI